MLLIISDQCGTDDQQAALSSLWALSLNHCCRLHAPTHPALQISSLEWSTSKLRGPHGPTHVLATAGMDGRVRLWAAPQKLV